MKLYNSVGPNPHVVRMFMAEKGIEIPLEKVDLRGGENRREPYLSEVNRRGQLPALQLDDGSVVCETTAICEYLEEIQPQPALIGTTPAERAETRMWTRRVDLGICEPMANGFRFAEGRKMFAERIRVLPEAADGLKAVAHDGLAWLDEEMAARTYICGERLTLADIKLYCFVTFGAAVNQPLDGALANLTAWRQRMGERSSASA